MRGRNTDLTARFPLIRTGLSRRGRVDAARELFPPLVWARWYGAEFGIGSAHLDSVLQHWAEPCTPLRVQSEFAELTPQMCRPRARGKNAYYGRAESAGVRGGYASRPLRLLTVPDGTPGTSESEGASGTESGEWWPSNELVPDGIIMAAACLYVPAIESVGEEAPGDEFRAFRDKWYVKM